MLQSRIQGIADNTIPPNIIFAIMNFKKSNAFVRIPFRNQILIFTVAISAILSCTTVDIFEKSITLPGHAWQSTVKPEFDFIIKDTTVPYQVFLVFRHNDKYNFNNLFINLYIKGPDRDTVIKFQKDLLLATNEKGWLGQGMDDIYEHRITIGTLGDNGRLAAGNYHFMLEQIMREDPLQNVLNVGLRVEKK